MTPVSFNHFPANELTRFATNHLPVRPQIVIFDLSGTLVDSLTKGDRDVLNEICLKLANENYVSIRRIKDNTRSLRHNFQNFFGEKAGEAYEEYVYKLTQALPVSQLFKAAVDVVCFARENAIRTAIITNRPKSYAQAALAQHKINGLFDTVISGDNDEKIEKPNPAIISLVLRELKMSSVPRNAVLMVGDTIVDVMCADAANVVPVLFSRKEINSPEMLARIRDDSKRPLVWVPSHAALLAKIAATL